MKNQNVIIYNSDLIIRNANELATLAVFYDKVYLPYTSPETSHLFTGARLISVTMPSGIHPEGKTEFFHDVGKWWRVYYPLLSEGVVQKLPKPPWEDKPPFNNLSSLNLQKKLNS